MKTILLIASMAFTQCDAWPVKVTKVYLNDKFQAPEYKWCVETENGVLYHTNTKPKVGDVAFCLDDKERIVKYDYKKNKCSCEL